MRFFSQLIKFGVYPPIFRRLAADVAALINGTTAQTLYVYNTFTSDTVYERGFMRWVSNVFEIGCEHVGGSDRTTRIRGLTGVRFSVAGSDEVIVGATTTSPAVASGNSLGTASLPWLNGVFSGVVRTIPVAVTALPSASTSGAGARHCVNDANNPTFGATVASGGAVTVPVYSDGTNWKVG